MDKITIKTDYEKDEKQFWFAENEQGELICLGIGGRTCFQSWSEIKEINESVDQLGLPATTPSWKFYDFDKIKSALENHFKDIKKSIPDSDYPKIVEILEF